jgi:hypothetical protein
MTDAHVRRLFDQYAARYDTALTEQLAYRGPACCARRRQRRHGRRRTAMRFRAVLDLGCGTGLCGAAFRPHADWLTGVDLSPAMIAQAAAKRPLRPPCARRDRSVSWRTKRQSRKSMTSFWRPMCSSISTTLRRRWPRLRACSRQRRRGLHGREKSGDGVKLLPTLRYAHADAYLRQTLEAARPLPLASRRSGACAEPKGHASSMGSWWSRSARRIHTTRMRKSVH